jgi:hypothetical protein
MLEIFILYFIVLGFVRCQVVNMVIRHIQVSTVINAVRSVSSLTDFETPKTALFYILSGAKSVD